MAEDLFPPVLKNELAFRQIMRLVKRSTRNCRCTVCGEPIPKNTRFLTIPNRFSRVINVCSTCITNMLTGGKKV